MESQVVGVEIDVGPCLVSKRVVKYMDKHVCNINQVSGGELKQNENRTSCNSNIYIYSNTTTVTAELSRPRMMS